MEIHTLIMAGLLAFLLGPASSGSLPDLCDDVYLDEDGVPIHDVTGRTLARYCEQTGPRAPIWGGAVCCSFSDGNARCDEPDSSGACDAVEKAMWCDYGERNADGTVTCYQPLPSACEFIDCVAPPPDVPQEGGTPLCCITGGCFELEYNTPCGGFVTMCYSPYTNEDGTVGCADLE